MDEFINTFHIDWHTMVAQLINFAIVFALLYLLAAKPLKKMIDERGKEIEGGLEDAKKNAETLAKSQSEYTEIMANARKEAMEFNEKNKKEEENRKVEMMEKTKAEVAGMIENGKKSLEIEKTKMVQDAKNELANLVLKATEKVLVEKQ